MLIIFDLDDTLVDTSKSITPHRLNEALIKIQAQGLNIGDFESALERLIQIDKEAPNAEYALKQFLKELSADESYFVMAKEIVYNNKNLDMPIHATEGAHSVLKHLFTNHQLALVTVGEEDLQMQKLKKAGLDLQLFSMIVVTPHKDKKQHYSKIIKDLRFESNDVVVCGDKVDVDLVPAKELGFKTIHMKNGRGVNSKGSPGLVDFTITKLFELEQIINSIKKNHETRVVS